LTSGRFHVDLRLYHKITFRSSAPCVDYPEIHHQLIRVGKGGEFRQFRRYALPPETSRTVDLLRGVADDAAEHAQLMFGLRDCFAATRNGFRRHAGTRWATLNGALPVTRPSFETW
jgi:hypothetical protein